MEAGLTIDDLSRLTCLEILKAVTDKKTDKDHGRRGRASGPDIPIARPVLGMYPLTPYIP